MATYIYHRYDEIAEFHREKHWNQVVKSAMGQEGLLDTYEKEGVGYSVTEKDLPILTGMAQILGTENIVFSVKGIDRLTSLFFGHGLAEVVVHDMLEFENLKSAIAKELAYRSENGGQHLGVYEAITTARRYTEIYEQRENANQG